MHTARRIGVSYSRFSCMIQADGDSEGRQDRDYRAFCQRHNLTPACEVFADRGRSGYKDEHRKKGRLGQLIGFAKDGRFDAGTVIVIEAWDRLGRLRPDKQTELVAELLRTGVSIGICRLDDVFTEEDFGTHKWTTLAVFIQLAYQESKQKADRVAASWEQRRKRVREQGGLLTRCVPAWIEVVNGEPRLIPERAAVIRRIFTLASEGFGHTRIVATLDKEKVPAFGEHVVNPGRTRSQFAGRWCKPYVAVILRDRRVLGELQPFKDDKPDGTPLVGQWPPAVTEDLFLLARAGQEERNNRDSLGRKVGARQGKYVNAFKGMLTHARDGEGMLLHNKGSGAKPDLILINGAGNGGRGKSWTIPYHAFEEAIFRQLREVNAGDILPRTAEAPDRAEVLRVKLKNVRHDIASIKEDLKAGYSKTLGEVVRALETTEEETAIELQEELARTVKPAARAWKDLPSLIDLIRSADDPDEARLKLRPVLRRIVESAWVLIVPRGSYRIVYVQIYFTGGECRDYLILHQTAAYRRKGGCWYGSPEDVAKPGKMPLDLRDRKETAKMETALLAIDIEKLSTRLKDLASKG